MNNISVGKYRNLQQCSTSNKTFSILAIDHRNNLRKLLNIKSNDINADNEIMQFKLEIVEYLSEFSSATLLDPEFSAIQSVLSGAIPGKTGIIVALEETGYKGNQEDRESKLLNDWNVNKSKRMNASGVKLLVYYHPKSQKAELIEDLVQKVSLECKLAEIAFFLEPLSYSLNPLKNVLENNERQEVIIETARRLGQLGPDVLKMEFPIDIIQNSDKKMWEKACQNLSNSISIPWVLLSASVDFELFIKQAIVAFENGASGVAIGRAVWKEATLLDHTNRRIFLQTIAQSRMKKITYLSDALARPWTDFYSPLDLSTNLYKDY